MKKITLLAVGLTFSVMAIAQSYEGSLEFKMETNKDTTTNIYYVKNNTIKLDQLGRKSGKVEGSFLFDLDAKKVKYINPIRKVWGEHNSEMVPVINGVCVSTKGANTKLIQGQKCVEYIVKNTEENTQITYWITMAKFDFFSPLVKLWNRKDKQSIYFLQIKDLPKGSMPLMSEEKTISDMKTVSKLEVSKISKGAVDASKISIPSDFNKFEQK